MNQEPDFSQAKLAALVGTIRSFLELPVKNVDDIQPEEHSHEIGNAIQKLTAERDSQRKLAGELIAAIRVNVARGTFGGDITSQELDVWLEQFTSRLLPYPKP